jgi:hypothetical protein
MGNQGFCFEVHAGKKIPDILTTLFLNYFFTSITVEFIFFLS